MAIEKYGAELLAFARTQGACFERVLMIGRQNLNFPQTDIFELERLLGFPLRHMVKNGRDLSYAEPLFDALGAKEIDAVDCTAYEGCTVQHDMNTPIADVLKNRFDIVFDGGSLEHIFNAPRALANCMEMLAEEGMLLSVTPASNLNGHGFYQFSPEFFFQTLSEQNGFKILGVAICELGSNGRVFQVKDPASAGNRALFKSNRPAYIAVAAKKEKTLEPFVSGWPQQSDYSARWEAAGFSSPNEVQKTSSPLRAFMKATAPGFFRHWVQSIEIERVRIQERGRVFTQIESLLEMREPKSEHRGDLKG